MENIEASKNKMAAPMNYKKNNYNHFFAVSFRFLSFECDGSLIQMGGKCKYLLSYVSVRERGREREREREREI